MQVMFTIIKAKKINLEISILLLSKNLINIYLIKEILLKV